MKKSTYIIAGLFALGLSSCSDMLEVDSTSELFEPDMGNKTDSVFYTFGIMAAMQQLGDMYVLQNELRGDLVSTTSQADVNLQQLANYSADTSNAYDSAYVYYRVINNVNYYLEHRDTTLSDASTNLVMNEYVAMKTFRAWAYLQAVRQYGKVKYVTHSLTSISEIENDASPELGIKEIAQYLVDDLAQYTGYSVPSYGSISRGSGNNSYTGGTSVASSKCFIPVDIILGDLYLEMGEYLQAATHYYTYINNNASTMYATAMSPSFSDLFNYGGYSRPSDMSWDVVNSSYGSTWSNSFSVTSSQIVSQIPFAQNYMNGTTTTLPSLWGFDYYTANDDSVYSATFQLEASSEFDALADSADIYYVSSVTSGSRSEINYFRGRDARSYSSYVRRTFGTSDERNYMRKFNEATIPLYRVSTIWLRLAEALNRAGYPDAAFAILKDGLNNSLIGNNLYLASETETFLTTTLPICSASNANSSYYSNNVGIHSYGTATYSSSTSTAISGVYSPYQMDSIVGNKMAQIQRDFGVEVGTTKADTINAVEDLICDEYAMELAFEGSRFSDLTRLARRKNADGLYGDNFGGKWFARKMEHKNAVVDLTVEDNWYLPLQ